MRKVLYLLSELNEHALDWLADAGRLMIAQPGQVLVEEGKPIEILYITLQGKFEVKTKGRLISDVGAGEIIGELSFLDSRPPAATVITIEKSSLLCIPAARLHSKLKTDPHFSSSFYRALAVMMAHRLRDTTLQLAFGGERRVTSDEEEPGELSPELLDNLNLASARFDSIRRRLESRSGSAS